MSTNIKWIIGIVLAGIAASVLIVWVIYSHSPTFNPNTPAGTFGTGENTSTVGATASQETNTSLPSVPQTLSTQKVFKLSDGPVAGATLLQTSNPTSTIARFVMATNGHAFDLLLDSQGAVPKTISNTTIPGIAKVLWSEKGRGALLQYLDGAIIKTVHLGLAAAGATTTSLTRIQFLPADISSLAVSPDGTQVAYTVKTAAGVDGYTSRADGADAAKKFSLPLSQIQLLWPAIGTLLAQSAPATGVEGVVFSINSNTGAAAPLIYAQGLTATADRNFNYVIYQTTGNSRSTYAQNVKTGLATGLSFDPIPELCTWSLATSTVAYCATPLSYVGANYLDQLHLGLDGGAMGIVRFDLTQKTSDTIAMPGGADGGEQADIAEIEVSPSDDYLLFIRKGDRSLWGVRLKN